MGLCLGFSGLSAIEILYFCTFRLWFRRKRIRHNAKRIARKFIVTLKRLSGNLTPIVAEREIRLQKHNIPVLGLNQKDIISTLMWQQRPQARVNNDI